MDKTKFIAIGLATYVDMSDIAAAIVSAFESAYRLITMIVMQSRSLESLLYFQVNAGHSKVIDYNKPNWKKVSSEIRAGKLKVTELMLTYPEPEGAFLSSDTSGLFYRIEPDRPNKPLIVKLTIKRHLLDDSSRNMWQDGMIAWGSEWFTRLKCIYGYMTHDYESLSYAYNDNLYEASQGIGYKYPLADYRRWLPGYFWGNWLSRDHIEQLGGLEQLRHEAPCVQIRGVSGGDNDSVFLQLTENIDDYSDESLDRLRRFLCPIVPRCNELPHHKPNTVRYRVIYDDTNVGSTAMPL